MRTDRPPQTDCTPVGDEHPTRSWPAWAQILASLALLYHFAALLSGCLAAAPSSPVEVGAYEAFRPYCDLIYQGVGYRYYSRLDTTVNPAQPRPWGTPVVIAEMETDAPGGVTRRETLRLPDSHPVWPRLRHQRRIDLAYHLAADPRWTASYARHLCKATGCDRVAIYAQAHNIPDLARIRAAADHWPANWLDLEDGSTYGPRFKLGDFRCTDFSPK